MIDNRIIEDPEYRDPGLTHYSGNPLIEALPPILSYQDAADILAFFPPPPTSQELSLPIHLRIHCVGHLRNLVIPLPEYCNFESLISTLIRQGYVNRNPLNNDSWGNLYQSGLKSGVRKPLPSRNVTEAGMLFSGLSGMGKSTFIERILSSYPQVIQHTRYKDRDLRLRQIVWLKVDCPADGTAKGLSRNFLKAVDDVLDTSLNEQSKRRRDASWDLLNEIQSVAQKNFLGILFLDELHHLKRPKLGKDEKLLDSMASLFNSIQVPVAGIGTPSVSELFSKKLQNVRRQAGKGLHVFRRPDDPNGPDWIAFVDSLSRYCWLTKKIVPDDSFRRALYHFSGGITFYAIANIILGQYRILLDGDTEELDATVFEQIAAEELAPLQSALKVLRSSQRGAEDYYEDLVPKDESLRYAMDPQSVISKASRPSTISKVVHNSESLPKPPKKKNVSRKFQDSSAYEKMKESGDIPQDPSNFGD